MGRLRAAPELPQRQATGLPHGAPMEVGEVLDGHEAGGSTPLSEGVGGGRCAFQVAEDRVPATSGEIAAHPMQVAGPAHRLINHVMQNAHTRCDRVRGHRKIVAGVLQVQVNGMEIHGESICDLSSVLPLIGAPHRRHDRAARHSRVGARQAHPDNGGVQPAG